MDHRSYLLGALILAVTVAVYRDTLRAEFVYEDRNGGGEIYAPWRGLALEGQAPINIIAHLGFLPHVRYFTNASYRLNAAVSVDPRSYHAVNLGVHLMNGVLVALLAAPIVGPVWAVAAMGVFLLHPLQTEAVAAIVNRSELLATLFVLLTLLASTVRRVSVVTVCGAFVFGTAAFYAKETTASGLLLALPLLLLARRLDRPMVRLAPLGGWVLACAAAAWTLAASPETFTMNEMTYAAFVLRQVVGVGLLTLRAVAPYTQTVELGLSHASIPLAIVAIVAVAQIGAAYWIMLAGRADGLGITPTEAMTHRERWGLWAALWIVGCVALRVFAPQPEHIHEHAFYLPMVGLSLAAVSAFTRATYGEHSYA